MNERKTIILKKKKKPCDEASSNKCHNLILISIIINSY